MSPALGRIFVLYSTSDGDILWAKTLLVNALIWGAIFCVVQVIRGVSRELARPKSAKVSALATKSSSPGVAAPETASRLRGTVSLADSDGDLSGGDPSGRLISPLGDRPSGVPSAGDAVGGPKLRVSMGRGSGVPAAAEAGRPVATNQPKAVCPVCATVLPSASDPCLACGHSGS